MKTILVTGATGHQGSAVVRNLLLASPASPSAFNIVALTRNPSSEAAKSLKSLDEERIELAQCNLNDEKAVHAVFERYKDKEGGIYGVFCVLAFPGLGKPALDEERQGKVLVDCAVKHDVHHFVFSSVDRGGFDHDDQYTLDRAAKVAIERYLKKRADETSEGAMNWTILLPGFFMQNFLGTIGKVTAAVLREGLKPDTKVQLIAADDIGAIARVVFENRDQFSSKVFTVASEALTGTERDDAYRRATGSKNGLPSVPAIVARGLIKWNDLTRLLCEDIERVHNVYTTAGQGDSEANLHTFREALKDIGMTSFEAFCAKNYPNGRLYEETKRNAEKKGWNGVTITGLVKDSTQTNRHAI